MKKTIFVFLVLNVILMLFLCTGVVHAVNNNETILNDDQKSNSISLASGGDIVSSTYLISDTYSYIGRILPRTTVEQFKLGFNVSGENIHIYKDSDETKEISQGYLGSNMNVKFDGVYKVYTISVVGDFNGDGLSNQIEIQHLIKHIVNPDKFALKDIALISADVNNDGNVNQIDLTQLINYVVFGRLNIGEINRPKSPKIEVISGEREGNNGPYTTDVIVKITPQETQNVDKTTYIISGSIQTEETEIPENGQKSRGGNQHLHGLKISDRRKGGKRDGHVQGTGGFETGRI